MKNGDWKYFSHSYEFSLKYLALTSVTESKQLSEEEVRTLQRMASPHYTEQLPYSVDWISISCKN